ncbi:MAG: hypothetical protein AAB403_05400 [Planctomycetota bacterium]
MEKQGAHTSRLLHVGRAGYDSLVRAAPPRLRRFIKRPINVALAGLTIAWALFLASEWTAYGEKIMDWDWMLISSGPAFIPTIYLSSRIRPEFYRVFRSILRGGGLPNVTILRTDTRLQFEEYARQLERRGGWLIAGAEFATISYVFVASTMPQADSGAIYDGSTVRMFVLLVLCTFCGWIAGTRFGRLHANASLLRFLDRHGWRMRLIPGHPDGFGGMNRFGTFLIFQFSFTAVPLTWLVVWAIIAPFWDHPAEFLDRLNKIYGWKLQLPDLITRECWNDRSGTQICSEHVYPDYSGPFMVLWLIAFGYMIAAVIFPLYRIHQRMVVAKQEITTQIGTELRQRYAAGRHALTTANTPGQALDALDQYSRTVGTMEDLRTLQIWPLGIRAVVVLIATKFLVYGLPLAAYMATSSNASEGGIARYIAAPLGWIVQLIKLLL